MKKSIVLTKASALLLALCLLLPVLTGCTKKSVTTDELITLAEENQFITEDATNQFTPYEFIKEVTIVAPESLKYQIEFYVLSDEAYAKSFFENNKTEFMTKKSGKYTTKSTDGKNYATFTLHANEKYMFLERIDNTVVYVNAPEEYEAAITEFLKGMKY